MKTYIPSNYLNNNYSYYLNNNNIVVRTNQNCYYNYNTEYCDCYDIVPSLDYATSNAYACSVSTYNHTLNYNNLTDNYYYKINFDKTLIIFFIIVIFAFYFPFRVFSRMFGRWLKW